LFISANFLPANNPANCVEYSALLQY